MKPIKYRYFFDIAFWLAMLLPSILDIVFNTEQFQQEKSKFYSFELYALFWLMLVITIYYIVGYHLTPRFVYERNNRKKYLLLMIFVWIVGSLINLMVEVYLTKTNKDTLKFVEIFYFFIGMFWLVFIVMALSYVRVSYEREINIKE